jgi:hypothetical protein
VPSVPTFVRSSPVGRFLLQIDVHEYGIRIQLSEEAPAVPTPQEQMGLVQGFERNISRTSFILTHMLRLDLSMVTSVTGLTTYEVELELVQPYSAFEAVRQFPFAIGELLKYVQNSNFPISKAEMAGVKQFVCSLLNVKQFRNAQGSQIRTFQKEDLWRLFDVPYAVGVKNDGVRCQCFISGEGNVFLYHRKADEPDEMRVFMIGMPNQEQEGAKEAMAEYAGTLLEGELEQNDGFVVFDLLAYRDKDVRGNPKWTLIDRLPAAREVVEAVCRHTNAEIVMKTFSVNQAPDPASLASEIRRLLGPEGPAPEGLVFVPVNECQPASAGERTNIWPTLMKWKPAELTTIDFRVSFDGENAGLLVGVRGREVPFRPESFPEAYRIANLLVEASSVSIQHGCIVEVSVHLDGEGGIRFAPVRVRRDKVGSSGV